jgi:hypothetical protein
MEGGAAEFSECQRCQESSDCLVMELYAKHGVPQTSFTPGGFLPARTRGMPSGTLSAAATIGTNVSGVLSYRVTIQGEK